MKNPDAVALGRLGGLKGGKARAAKLSKERRLAISKKAAEARWGTKTAPEQNAVKAVIAAFFNSFPASARERTSNSFMITVDGYDIKVTARIVKMIDWTPP